MSLVLSISLTPFGGGWQLGEILWAYLPEVLLYHTFQPLHFVSHTPVCPLEGVESAVYLLLAFFSFLRSGELLSLQRGDLHRTTDGLYVHIWQSKTDPFRSGAVARVLPTGDPSLCAVTSMDSYLTSRDPAAGPLFQLQTAALTRQRLNSLIRDLASRSGVDPSRYSSHSFRIGAALAAAAARIPHWRIKALGHWSSDCYKRYIRLPSSETTGVTAALARAPI